MEEDIDISELLDLALGTAEKLPPEIAAELAALLDVDVARPSARLERRVREKLILLETVWSFAHRQDS